MKKNVYWEYEDYNTNDLLDLFFSIFYEKFENLAADYWSRPRNRVYIIADLIDNQIPLEPEIDYNPADYIKARKKFIKEIKEIYSY